MKQVIKIHYLTDVIEEMAPLVSQGLMSCCMMAQVGSDYKRVLSCISPSEGEGGAVTVLDPRGNPWSVVVKTTDEYTDLLINAIIRTATWFLAKDIRDLGGPGAQVFIVGVDAILLRDPEVTFASVDGKVSTTFRVERGANYQDHKLLELSEEES